MSKCVTIVPHKVCFSPTSGAGNVDILQHVIYENGQFIGQAYTTVDDPSIVINISTYLGGGTIS